MPMQFRYPHQLYFYINSETGIFRDKHNLILIFAEDIDCKHSLEPPQRKHTIYVKKRDIRKISQFLSKIVIFTNVKIAV